MGTVPSAGSSLTRTGWLELPGCSCVRVALRLAPFDLTTCLSSSCLLESDTLLSESTSCSFLLLRLGSITSPSLRLNEPRLVFAKSRLGVLLVDARTASVEPEDDPALSWRW